MVKNDIEEMMINSMIRKAKNNIKENDYVENGLLYCGNCHTEKEFILPSGRKVPCMCDCMEKQYQEQEAKEKLQDFVRNNIRNIDSQYRNISLKDIDDIDTDTDLSFIKPFIENFIEFKKASMGLYIFGNYGNGKTTIASAIANELLQNGYRVLMTPCNEAINQISDRDNAPYYKDKLKNMDLIILDDFGSNRDTEFQKEQLYNLFDFLYSNRKCIILTTNVPRKELANRDNIQMARTYDRIIEMTKGIMIKRESMRIKISKEKQSKLDELLKIKGE